MDLPTCHQKTDLHSVLHPHELTKQEKHNLSIKQKTQDQDIYHDKHKPVFYTYNKSLVLSTVQLCLVAVDRHYGSEMRLSRPVIMYAYLKLLGVTISSDLSPVKHVSTISSSCFYWLHQIRRIRQSPDAESAKTLVHAFITSRIQVRTSPHGAPSCQRST